MKNLQKLLWGAAIGTLAIASVQGGPADAKKTVIEECTVPFTGSVSFGYEGDYLFRGLNRGSNALWGSAAANFALGENLSLDIGTWYINPTNQKDFVPFFFGEVANVGDELDTFAFLNFELPKGIKASWGVTSYVFPEANSANNEIDDHLGGFRPFGHPGTHDTWETSLGLSKDLGPMEVGAFIAYDFDFNDGWYYELRASKSIPLRDCLDLNLGTGIAYSDNGLLGINDWTHCYLRTGLGWHMTQAATLNLYGGYNWMLDGLNDALGDFQEDEIHWGTSVTVSF